MQTGDVTYERDGATLRAYAAWPDAAGRLPALVLIPDVRGVSDHYRDVARRFAGEGFFTLAVDLYSREGAPDLPDMPAVFRFIRALPDTRVLSDLGRGGRVSRAAAPRSRRRRSASPASASAGSTRSWRHARCRGSRRPSRGTGCSATTSATP
jgi:dienelactone hydrolase